MIVHHLARMQAMNGFAVMGNCGKRRGQYEKTAAFIFPPFFNYRVGLPIYEGKNGKRFSIRQ